jgi:hypothetical protein
MGVAYKILYSGQPTTSAAAVYAPTNASALVDHAVVCNPTAGAVTLTAHVIDGGGTAADANIIYHEKSIAAGATEVLTALLNLRLEAGDEIEMLASANTSLTVTISGREVS